MIGGMAPQADVLIVDDEPHLPELLGHLLTRYGYTVACASTGEEALEYLEAGPVRLVISDHFLHLGELSGLDLIRELRQRWEVPVLVVTACIDEPILTSLRSEPGVRELIRKPFDLLRLKSRVDEVVRGDSGDSGEGAPEGSPSSS